jgi:predicted MFS family arabinose efflux permease
MILAALAARFGFTDPQLGWIGGIENAGLLAGSVIASGLATRFPFRTLTATGLVVALGATLATPLAGAFGPFCAIRLVGGLGNGLCYAGGVAALSLTARPERNFSVFVVVLVLANSLELWVIPDVAAAAGVPGIYGLLAALYVLPLALLGRFPGRAPVRPAADTTTGRGERRTLAAVAIGAIVLFNVAASAMYAYSERIGGSVGLSERAIANTLTWCNLFSITGPLLAYALARRFGQHRPQLAALAILILVYVSWAAFLSRATFAVGVLLFFEVWSLVNVYQLGTLTELDDTRRGVALLPAAQGVGQAVGPTLGGVLLERGLQYPELIGVQTGFALACFASYAWIWLRVRSRTPTVPASPTPP